MGKPINALRSLRSSPMRCSCAIYLSSNLGSSLADRRKAATLYSGRWKVFTGELPVLEKDLGSTAPLSSCCPTVLQGAQFFPLLLSVLAWNPRFELERLLPCPASQLDCFEEVLVQDSCRVLYPAACFNPRLMSVKLMLRSFGFLLLPARCMYMPCSISEFAADSSRYRSCGCSICRSSHGGPLSDLRPCSSGYHQSDAQASKTAVDLFSHLMIL